MTNDDTRPLPAEGAPPARAEGRPVDGVTGVPTASPPAAPSSAWATSQPVVPPSPSPYGPPPAYGPPPPGEAPALADRGPRPPGQGRRLLGIVGLVALGAVAGGLIVNAVDGFRATDTAALQPAAASQNGQAGPNAAVPGGGGPQGGV